MESDNELDTHSAESENRSYIGETNEVLIKEFELSPESSTYSDSSGEENETTIRKEKKKSNEIASIYSHIQKLVRYLKVMTLLRLSWSRCIRL